MRTRRSLLAFALVSCVLFTACPSSSDLDRMAKASRELAHDTETSEKIIGEFYKAGKIPLAKKDQYAVTLKTIAVNGKRFNDTLIQLDKQYPQGNVPPQNLAFLKSNFLTISQPFQELLADLNLFGLGSAVKGLSKDVSTIEGVLK